jgi:hypothetical protein
MAGRAGAESKKMRPLRAKVIISMDQDSLIQLVPIGEENAVTARLIWQLEKVGTIGTLRHKLSSLATKGLIEKKHVKSGHKDTAVFFRKQG